MPTASAPGRVTVAQAFEIALAHHQANRGAEAEAIYRKILALEPAHADALHLLGVLAYQAGNDGQAIDLIGQAITVNPQQAAYHCNLGSALQRAGRWAEAEASLRRAIALNPAYAEAYNNLGNGLQARQDYAEAISCYRQAITHKAAYFEAYNNLGNALQAAGDLVAAVDSFGRALAYRPDYAVAHNNLGHALKAQGRTEAALDSYRRAVELEPDFSKAWLNLGNALLEQGDLPAALDSCRRALALEPDGAEAHDSLGNVLQASGEVDMAIVHFRRAIALTPAYAEAHFDLGNGLRQLGLWEAALAAYRQAISLKPNFPPPYNNAGDILKNQGQFEAALAYFERALVLDPAYVEAHNNRGLVLQEQGRLDDAIACYRHALALRPDYAVALNNWGRALSSQGQFEQALQCFRQALSVQPEFAVVHSNLLFHLNHATALPPAAYLQEALCFGAQAAARAQPYTAWPVDAAVPASAPPRLRIGFVSGDLRLHPVGYFLESVLAHLDRDRFELVAYVTRPGEDALTARLKAGFSEWRSLVGLNDRQAAAQIYADGLHILVDLAGHTADNRLPVFAWKPAPLQVAWLGYFASTGVAAIDYIIADWQVLPMSDANHFSETPWRLPDCYLCFTPPSDPVEVGPLPCLAQDGFTFGCFNKLNKMNDAVVALWARVLHAVPDARLLLKSKELIDAAQCQAVSRRFALHGIDPARLILEGHTPRSAYLADYRRVDLALDPFPYPGGTTTVEALWMGVPVLSRRGDRFLSRAGESLLTAAGLGSWLAADEHDYVAKARAFAADRAGLAALRAALRAQLLASPLCDAERFAAHLGDAFSQMWQRRGRPA